RLDFTNPGQVSGNLIRLAAAGGSWRHTCWMGVGTQKLSSAAHGSRRTRHSPIRKQHSLLFHRNLHVLPISGVQVLISLRPRRSDDRSCDTMDAKPVPDEAKELKLVNTVELKIAMTTGDDKLEAILKTFLTALLLKLASPHSSVRNKVCFGV